MSGLESIGILLTLAAEEAVSAAYGEITVAHLLIALARLADPDAATRLHDGALKDEFDQVGIEPRRFRRRLRALLGSGNGRPTESAIHRSGECKAVFALAELIAARNGVVLSPNHLLYAALLSFGRTASQRGGLGAEEECSYCQAKRQPVFLDGEMYCSACRKQIAARAVDGSPSSDEIPAEL